MAFFSRKKEEKLEVKAEKKQEDKPEAVASTSSDVSLSLPQVLVQPRISEKAGLLARLNKYVFIVKKKTNKVEVKKAVESKYKVKVVQVNAVNTKGKTKTFGRTIGTTSAFKKAIVTLRKGDSIKGLTDVA